MTEHDKWNVDLIRSEKHKKYGEPGTSDNFLGEHRCIVNKYSVSVYCRLDFCLQKISNLSELGKFLGYL